MAVALNPFAERTARFADRKSLGQEIASLIKQAIAEGSLSPGQRIIESRLARDFGVSLTPVREAIRQLAGEGIIEISPNRGPSVWVVTAEDAFELYSLRAMLEGLAIRMAIARASPEERASIQAILDEMERLVDDDGVPSLLDNSRTIHEGIVRLSKHDYLIAVYNSLALRIAIVNRILGRESFKRREVEWHRPLVDALLGRDPDHAERIIREHIRESYLAYTAVADGSKPATGHDVWF
ncbi:MAG: GntR family transcriptional regulator [Thermomicrobiales bacterium]